MDANEVASYLKSHPEFFELYSELLLQIHIPSPHEGRAISITERQMSVMRDKVKLLEAKLAELITFGEENDLISTKVHRMAVALLAAHDVTTVLQVLYSHLGEDFAVPHVAVRLWDVAAGEAAAAAEFADVGDALRQRIGAMVQPYCGPAVDQEVVGWLGESASHVRSVAQIPLRRATGCIGLLLLASEEPHRFYAEMGTLYLERLGDMVAATVLRTSA